MSRLKYVYIVDSDVCSRTIKRKLINASQWRQYSSLLPLQELLRKNILTDVRYG
jgi:hypothetical protein